MKHRYNFILFCIFIWSSAPDSTMAQTLQKGNDKKSATKQSFFSINKKPRRISVGMNVLRYNTLLGTEEVTMINEGVRLSYEIMGAPGKLKQFLNPNNFGIGFASSNYFGLWMKYNSHMVDYYEFTMNKHFLSAYLFGEVDLKNISSFGVLAGPAINYTRVKASDLNVINPGETASKIDLALHTGIYIQKYITKNKAGMRKMFLRFGFDSYSSINSGFTNGGYFSFGF